VPTFADEFDRPELNREVWLPHYLPAWSSRAESAATYEMGGSCLRLVIPPDQDLWCADDHEPPIRISGIQSGNWSGPLGSTRGQQPYREGATVRERQDTFWGWTPGPGHIEIRARMSLPANSLAGFWLSGLETRPEESGEICVVEVFGRDVATGPSARVGAGIKAYRDPDAIQDFEAVTLPIDVGEFHIYACDWRLDQVTYLVDGEPIRHTSRPPTYPMQAMLAVCDFPVSPKGDRRDGVPAFEVDYIRGWEL
jgi:hypothetical protein